MTHEIISKWNPAPSGTMAETENKRQAAENEAAHWLRMVEANTARLQECRNLIANVSAASDPDELAAANSLAPVLVQIIDFQKLARADAAKIERRAESALYEMDTTLTEARGQVERFKGGAGVEKIAAAASQEWQRLQLEILGECDGELVMA